LLTPIAARERRISSEAPCWVPTFINALRRATPFAACVPGEPVVCPGIGFPGADPARSLIADAKAAPPKHAARENSLRFIWFLLSLIPGQCDMIAQEMRAIRRRWRWLCVSGH